jgi:hypothetical protein
MRVTTTIVAITIALLLLAAPRVQAQASLDAARQLYAAAEYDGALTMLDGLLTGNHPSEEKRAIEMYRVLCLVATGRDGDAQGAIVALVSNHPLYRPAEDLPPRVRTTFHETRKRALPTAIQTRYQEAKAAFDFKDYATAQRGFAQVLEVLADPDVSVQASQSPLKDLRMLAAGFLELSAKAAVPVMPVPVVQPQPAPVAPEPARVAVRAPKIYSSNDVNVVPPIALNQRIPALPGPIRMAHSGIIEVLIDDSGAVESATMIAPINPQYDRLALNAAKSWLYQPAKVDGVPVKFLKRIQVNLVPTGRND